MLRTIRHCRAVTTAALTVVAVLVLLLSALALSSTPASAQAKPIDKTSITVSPPAADLDVNPGTTYTHKIKLTNEMATKREFSVSVQNFTAKDEEGAAELVAGEGPYSLSQWIKVTPERVTIDPNKVQTFDIAISVPQNAPPGGHFGAIIFTPRDDSGNAPVSVTSQISSLILMRVPGAATEKAAITGINICKPKKTVNEKKETQVATTCDSTSKLFTSGGQMVATTRVQNDGNVQLQPRGTMKIYNIFGSKVASFDIGPRNVIPSSIRRLDGGWKSSFLLGFYKAKAELTYGSQGQTLNAETTFWGFPKREAIITLIVLLVLIPLLWLPRKRYKKAFRALTAGD